MNYAPPPQSKPFPVWAILLLVGGGLVAVVAVLAGVLFLGASGSSSAPAPPPTATSAPTSVMPTELRVTLTDKTAVGRDTHLRVSVRNKGARPIGRCTLHVHASEDVTWRAASAELQELGMFSTAKSYVVTTPIAAGDVKLYELVFLPTSPGRLTIGVSAEDDPAADGDRAGDSCATVAEQKQTVTVTP